MDSFWANLAEIIKAIPESPVVVSLLAITILAALGFFLFSKDNSNYRMVVFIGVFLIVTAIVLLLLVSWQRISPVSFYKIPLHSSYSYFIRRTDDVTLEQCLSKAKSALIGSGYSETDINQAGSSLRAGSFFNTREGIVTGIFCNKFLETQEMLGFTYGFDSGLVSEMNTKVVGRIDANTTRNSFKNLINVANVGFYYNNSELFLDTSTESCIIKIKNKFRILGLPSPYQRGGDVLTVRMSDGTFAAGCKQFQTPDGIPQSESGDTQFLFAITYTSFGAKSSIAYSVRERFGELLSDLPTIEKAALSSSSD